MPIEYYVIGIIILLMLALLTWSYGLSAPRTMFKGSVYIKIKFDYIDEATIIFNKPGLYHLAFFCTEFEGAKSFTNQTVMVKCTPHTLKLDAKWILRPVIVEITHDQKTERAKFL